MENRANKKITYTMIIAIIVCIVTIVVPLVPIKESLGTQTLSVSYYYPAKTKLNIKKGWMVSGSYSAERAVMFYIYTPDEETIMFKKTGVSSGIFKFIAETDGWYKIQIDSSWTARISVTFHAEQSSTVTILNFLISKIIHYI